MRWSSGVKAAPVAVEPVAVFPVVVFLAEVEVEADGNSFVLGN